MSDYTENEEKFITDELSHIPEHKLEDRYDEMLDDVYGDVEVAGMSYATSRVLKEIDDVAYRTGFNDWLDSEASDERLIEIDGEWYDADDVKDVMKDYVEEE